MAASIQPAERAALRRLDQQFDAIRAMPAPVPPALRHQKSVEELGVGGYLRVAGELYTVTEVNVYRERGGHWTELALFGLTTGETRSLEWEKDDEIEISFNGSSRSLRELGVGSDRIEEMADDEAGHIDVDGRRFHYDDDYGAHFCRGGTGEPVPVYFYDFETRDERFVLSVEEWGSAQDGYEYEAYVAEYMEPEEIEILVTGGG